MDTFNYDIPFSGKAILCVEKHQILYAVYTRIGRHLTAEEGNKVWADIQKGDDWKAVFSANNTENKLNFAELLRDDIEAGATKIVSDVWFNVLDDALKNDLDKAAAAFIVKEEEAEITLANVEMQTQKRIQDENVRNGLARCANESKKKSIEKWKRNYFLMEHNLDIQNVVLPEGKSEEDFMKHLEAFVRC